MGLRSPFVWLLFAGLATCTSKYLIETFTRFWLLILRCIGMFYTVFLILRTLDQSFNHALTQDSRPKGVQLDSSCMH